MMAVVVWAQPIWGANATWTGGGANNDWNNNDNWGGSAYPGTDNTDVATFTGMPTPQQPKWNLDNGCIGEIAFASAGWTISGAYYHELILRYGSCGISSQGVGTNEIRATLWQYTKGTWDVGTSNTLVLSGNFEQRVSPTKTGAGKLVMMGVGTGDYRNNGGGMTISEGTVLCNYTTKSTEGNNSWNVSGGATLGGNGTINIATDPLENRAVNVSMNVSGAGSTLAPGGDGYFGASIGTLTVNFGGTNVAANRIRLQDGTRLAMDISAWNGVSDRLAINLLETTVNGYLKLDEAGSQTLALSGPTRMPYGNNYTLVTFPTTAIDYGRFDLITYNGADVTNNKYVNLNHGASSIDLFFLPRPDATVLFVR